MAAPRFQPCVLGMLPSELERVMPRVAPPQWRVRALEMGRRPFDSRASPLWRASFEAFALSERFANPAFRKLLRFRGGVLGVPPNNSGDVDSGVVTVTLAMSSSLQATVLKTAPADFAGDLPVSVARSLCSSPLCIAYECPHVV